MRQKNRGQTQKARPRGRPFSKGNQLGKGRPIGSKNRRTLLGAELLQELEKGGDGLPPAGERWTRLLNDKDPAIRIAAERFVFEHLYGKGSEGFAPLGEGPIEIRLHWSTGRIRLPKEGEDARREEIEG